VLSDFDGADSNLLLQPEPFDRTTRHVRGTPVQTSWPQEWLLPVSSASAGLPVPAKSVFELPELPHPTAETVAQLGPRSKPAVVAERETPPEAVAVGGGDTPRALRGRHGGNQLRRGKQLTASRKTHHGTAVAAHGRPGKAHARAVPLKHLAQIKKRKV
jgi:peptidoglycan-N-acetylglucosamine deacetylase